jgi:pimeloyl-ACP methyl ester carboxylesterase
MVVHRRPQEQHAMQTDSASPSRTASLAPALAGTRHELQSAQAGRLSWYYAGPGRSAIATVPLVLVHSVNAAASAYEVKPLYDHYGLRRPVYALDLPGFGFSERSDRRYTPRLMTDAIHALLGEIRREHGPVPVDAIALSLSSEFLARAASEAPAQYRTVALVSPTGFNRDTLRTGPAGSTLGQGGLPAALRRLGLGRRVFNLLTRRRVIAYFLRRTWGSANFDLGLLDYDYLTTRPEGAEFAPLQFIGGLLFSGDSGTVYRSLPQPVWAIHGVRGDFTNYRALPLVASRANWTVEVLPTGAMPHLEMPLEFMQRYDGWIAAQASALARHQAEQRDQPFVVAA